MGRTSLLLLPPPRDAENPSHATAVTPRSLAHSLARVFSAARNTATAVCDIARVGVRRLELEDDRNCCTQPERRPSAGRAPYCKQVACPLGNKPFVNVADRLLAVLPNRLILTVCAFTNASVHSCIPPLRLPVAMIL